MKLTACKNCEWIGCTSTIPQAPLGKNTAFCTHGAVQFDWFWGEGTTRICAEINTNGHCPHFKEKTHE